MLNISDFAPPARQNPCCERSTLAGRFAAIEILARRLSNFTKVAGTTFPSCHCPPFRENVFLATHSKNEDTARRIDVFWIPPHCVENFAFTEKFQMLCAVSWLPRCTWCTGSPTIHSLLMQISAADERLCVLRGAHLLESASGGRGNVLCIPWGCEIDPPQLGFD